MALLSSACMCLLFTANLRDEVEVTRHKCTGVKKQAHPVADMARHVLKNAPMQHLPCAPMQQTIDPAASQCALCKAQGVPLRSLVPDGACTTSGHAGATGGCGASQGLHQVQRQSEQVARFCHSLYFLLFRTLHTNKWCSSKYIVEATTISMLRL